MRDEDDNTIKEKLEIVPVYVKNNPKDSDSFEPAPEHEEQEPVESEAVVKILIYLQAHESRNRVVVTRSISHGLL